MTIDKIYSNGNLSVRSYHACKYNTIETIEDLKIDLLIFAGKGKSNKNSNIYSKNTKQIIENIREWPVVIIPSSVHLEKIPKLVFVSNIEITILNSELER